MDCALSCNTARSWAADRGTGGVGCRCVNIERYGFESRSVARDLSTSSTSRGTRDMMQRRRRTHGPNGRKQLAQNEAGLSSTISQSAAHPLPRP